MKVRIGYGFGVRTALNDEGFGRVVDALEDLRFDSLWLSERISGPAPDPLVAMAFAAGRTRRLKFGMSVMVLPGRNPVVLAKELATLDRMSSGRLLPAFGLGVADPREQQAFGVAREDRAKIFDEALHVVRSCWAEGSFTYHGTHFHFDDLRVEPKPVQSPPEVWLGGIAPSELKRVARLADGWLPSFVTSDDVAAGRAEIERVAADHDRAIDPEHFGVLIPYVMSPPPSEIVQGLKARRPDLDDVSRILPTGWSELTAVIDRFIDVGFSKFVVVPLSEPASPEAWEEHVHEAAGRLLP
ncbi:MAG: TIGR03619 family F420-dependent LLM class oxidoreductase, partial [Actinomycetota bacterium]